jgi:hypothetical protein
LVSEAHLRIYLAKSRFLSQVSNYQVAGHGSLWRFWLRGTSADEHRQCDEGLDGTFHLCHIFRRKAPAPAMLHALKLWAGLTRLLSSSPAALASTMELVPHRVEEDLRARLIRLIVRRQCQDFPHTQIHPALAGPDVPEAFERAS